jgi:hypothetical protein
MIAKEFLKLHRHLKPGEYIMELFYHNKIKQMFKKISKISKRQRDKSIIITTILLFKKECNYKT